MEKRKLSISIDGSELKLIRNPKRELCMNAAKIKDIDYSSIFPKDAPNDILYASMVAYTIGHKNKNACLILPEEGISTYKTCISKPLDLEHDREKIVGFCVNSYLTNIKNNKILDEEQAQEILANNGLVNVGTVFGIWKINCGETADLIEENFDLNSENYGKVRCSFEYYFQNFKFFISNGDADYPNGHLCLSDDSNPDADAMYEALKINGGNGKWKGNTISICPIDGMVGGIALTFTPANEYSDLTAKKDGSDIIVQPAIEADIIENKTIELEKSVNKDTGDQNMPEPVKIEDVVAEVQTDIKVEATLVPLSVDKDLADKLQSELNIKITELGAKENKVNELVASFEALKKENEEFKSKLIQAEEMSQKLQIQLDKEIEARKILEAKEIETVKQSLIASRLAKIQEFIELTQNNMPILSKECAEASDEEFATKLEFYQSISKKVVASIEPIVTPDVKSTVEAVVTETAKDTKSVNIHAAVPSESLIEQFAKAFNTKTFGYKI